MQNLPDELQNIIIFPKYYKPINKLSFNQKIYLLFQFRNTNYINLELNKTINKFKIIQNCFITNYIDSDSYYLSNKPIYKFLLYKLLKQKNKSTHHLTHDNYNLDYNLENYVLNNASFINNSNNITIEQHISSIYF